MRLTSGWGRTRCIMLWSGLTWLGAGNALPTAFADYRPPDQRTMYDDWIRDLEDKQAAKDRASAYQPGPSKPRDDSAREASDRYLRERMKEDDAYNARVGRENARIDALNADYARLRGLMAQVEAGDVPAMWRYGQELMQRADSDAKTREIGLQWVRVAADRGNADAKQWLANRQAERAGAEAAAQAEAQRRVTAEKEAHRAAVEKRLREQMAENEAEAKAGDVEAMFRLAQQYLFTTPRTDQDTAAMRYWYKQAAERDHPGALHYLITRGNSAVDTPEEQAEVLAWGARLAQLPGETETSHRMGVIYLTGELGAPKDRALAVPFLERSAAAGNLGDYFYIAEAYAHGLGGPRDVAEGIRRYQVALAQKGGTEFNDRTSEARLELTRLMLEPEAEPKAHRDALFALWDEGILGYGQHADALGRVAFNALVSGMLGISDPDREILYSSRPMHYGTWPDSSPQEMLDLAMHFGETLAQRSRDDAHPLYIIEKKEVRVNYANGNSLMEPQYSKIVARPGDALQTLTYVAAEATQPALKVRACLLAGGIAAELNETQLREFGYRPDLAFHLYDIAATQCDDATGWLESGRLLMLGQGLPRDPVAAQIRLQTAWDKGVAKAAFYLGAVQRSRLVPGASDEGAAEWWRQGAEKGDFGCMEYWGNYLVGLGTGKNSTQPDAAAKLADGISWMKKAAGGAMGGAQYDLATLYEQGIGVPQDDAQAVMLLQQAVDNGSAPAKAALAQRFAQGRGVAKDQPRALKLLYEAAPYNLGAANNLGVILWRGDWGEKDVESGLRWMEVTFEAGNWRTGRSLAKIYHLGLGVPADEEKARAYLEKAGALGGAESAAAVADFYEQGEIITKDPAAAHRWREKAAAATAT